MNKIKLTNCEIAYGTWGEGREVLVIQTGLISCCAEWWHIAKDLGKHFKVLVFDRPGYGESSLSSEPRTPANISAEMLELLDKLDMKAPVTLIGHSQGGLYCVDFAFRYPERVKGMMLLDPLTPFDHEFKEILTKSEYKKSGIDKIPMLKMGKTIAGLGLGFLLKPLLRKAPPFYYHNFSEEESEYILNSLTRRKIYDAAIQEYLLAERPENNEHIKTCIRRSALSTPTILVTHESDFYMRELARYSSLSGENIKKVEEKWQEIMIRYKNLSLTARHITAPQSGHSIHLTNYPFIKGALLNKL